MKSTVQMKKMNKASVTSTMVMKLSMVVNSWNLHNFSRM